MHDLLTQQRCESSSKVDARAPSRRVARASGQYGATLKLGGGLPHTTEQDGEEEEEEEEGG